MTKESLDLGDLVAGSSLLDQGILPGESISEHDATPNDVAEATRHLIDRVNDLPIQSEQHRDQVLGHAAERMEESVPLLDSDAIRRVVTIAKVQRAHARNHRRVITAR